MRFTKGGITLDNVLDMSEPELVEWIEVAHEVAEAEAEAVKGK